MWDKYCISQLSYWSPRLTEKVCFFRSPLPRSFFFIKFVGDSFAPLRVLSSLISPRYNNFNSLIFNTFNTTKYMTSYCFTIPVIVYLWLTFTVLVVLVTKALSRWSLVSKYKCRTIYHIVTSWYHLWMILWIIFGSSLSIWKFRVIIFLLSFGVTSSRFFYQMRDRVLTVSRYSLPSADDTVNLIS